jgi:hypothetical protein
VISYLLPWELPLFQPGRMVRNHGDLVSLVESRLLRAGNGTGEVAELTNLARRQSKGVAN